MKILSFRGKATMSKLRVLFDKAESDDFYKEYTKDMMKLHRLIDQSKKNGKSTPEALSEIKRLISKYRDRKFLRDVEKALKSDNLAHAKDLMNVWFPPVR